MSFERAMDPDPLPSADPALYKRYLEYKTAFIERAWKEVLTWSEWVKQLNERQHAD